jgi:signal transduction histidine kinase
MALCGEAAGQTPALAEYREAEWMADRNGAPDPATAKRVTLPHNLATGPRPAWYRIAIDVPAQSLDPHAVFISGAYAHLDVRFNGKPIGITGAFESVVPRGWRSVHLFTIPPEYWRTSGNELTIRAGGPAAWTFAAPRVGPLAVAERAHTLRLIGTAIAPFVAGVLVAVLGVFVLLLWFNHRSESLFAYFGAGSLLCGLHMAWWMLPEPPLPNPYNRILWNATYTLWVSVMTMFFLRYTETANRWIEKLLWTVALLGYPVLYIANTLGQFSNASLVWRGFAVLVISGALVHISIRAIRTRRREHFPLVVVGFLCVGFGVHDWWTGQSASGLMTRIPLVPYTGLLCALLFGWLLARRLNTTADQLAETQSTLHARVDAQTRELEEKLENTRRVERAQSALDERHRILEDMHDGLGAKLLVSLNALKDASVSRETAVTLLRDCLDELRLTVDAYDQDSGDLGAILAAVRHRLGDRLLAAGITIDWQVAETPPLPSLTRAGGRELMRIVQEAFTNAIRHSGGRTLGVASRALPETREVELTLSDDGQGFDPALRGEGLQRIERITQQLGARFAVLSSGRGTVLRFTFMPGAQSHA